MLKKLRKYNKYLAFGILNATEHIHMCLLFIKMTQHKKINSVITCVNKTKVTLKKK